MVRKFLNHFLVRVTEVAAPLQNPTSSFGKTVRCLSPAQVACWAAACAPVDASRRRRRCLVRDWVPQSELVRGGLLDKAKVVRGDVRDQPTLERALGEYEIDTVIHLAAQTIVGIANRNPVSTFESNVAGTWSLLEACRRSPLVKQIVVIVRQSLRTSRTTSVRRRTVNRPPPVRRK